MFIYICIYIHIYKDSVVERVRVGAAVHPGTEVASSAAASGGKQTHDINMYTNWYAYAYMCLYVHRRFIIQRGHEHTRTGN